MVDIFTVTNVLLLTTVSATITKKKKKKKKEKKKSGGQKTKTNKTKAYKQTNKQATRERNTEVVMLWVTVENTANFLFFLLKSIVSNY